MIDLSPLFQYSRFKLIEKVYKDWLIKRDRVLDIGCGDGLVTYKLSQKFNLQITGCDIENYLVRKINFVLMKSEDKLPFPDKSFDTVLFNDVLHHTSKTNQKSLLSEALRVARKSVLIFELKPTIGAYIGDFLINKIYHPSIKNPFTYKNPQEWLCLFGKYPVKADIKDISRPFFSLFSRVAFRLKKNDRL